MSPAAAAFGVVAAAKYDDFRARFATDDGCAVVGCRFFGGVAGVVVVMAAADDDEERYKPFLFLGDVAAAAAAIAAAFVCAAASCTSQTIIPRLRGCVHACAMHRCSIAATTSIRAFSFDCLICVEYRY